MNSAGWDKGGVYAADVLATEPKETNNAAIERRFHEFLVNFRDGTRFLYRESLRANINANRFHLQVDMHHLASYDQRLASNLQSQPLVYFPLLEGSAREYARTFWIPSSTSASDPLIGFQVTITWTNGMCTGIRDLNAASVGKLVRLPGIVISASGVVARPSQAFVMCKSCRGHLMLPVTSSFGSVSLPRTCTNSAAVKQVPCPLDPYQVIPERSICVDQQTLKLQETPDMVPMGELPRHVLLSVDRSLVNRVSPGSRVTINGVFSIFQSKGSKNTPNAIAIRSPYLKVLGIEQESDLNKGDFYFTEQEEKEFVDLAKRPDFIQLFTRNIAPSIWGNEDIKLAICCLLFGGSRKLLPDGMRIRGDLNILLLGDPGVAKSQLLKFVEKVAPVSVYTSGKGSSAAGLTASVNRDPGTGEFYLEGGAMVLADGGVVCIDEFDKMGQEDRVAIHEAMEQQTISIAKAGITTILNSRTSVLAAANPQFGRYDELKSPGENIDFSTTILSRFDMIFILKDEHNAIRDATLAKHVLSVHMQQQGTDDQADVQMNNPDWLPVEKMKRYIAYCRTKCAPRLSPAAAEKLASHYVGIRSELHEIESSLTERSSIPITVRQLEAIVRIAEALAKMTLSPVAEEQHVDEALRLFRISTMQAVLSGHSLEGMTRPDLVRQVDRVEKVLKERVAIGSTVSVRALVNELVANKGFPEHAVLRCVDMMVKQEKMLFRNQQKLLVRVS